MRRERACERDGMDVPLYVKEIDLGAVAASTNSEPMVVSPCELMGARRSFGGVRP